MIHRTAREVVIFMLVAAVIGSIGVGTWVSNSHRPIIDTSKAELSLFGCIGAQTSTGPAKARGIVENQV